ncbi:MAG: bifunctional (p)ppGpp synthetase/guanosine-3',5'-bis(diphosphate) 3'-pyrophosphohydrolase [Pyrinomonadaceae bacterium]|nr:bifunctional (p)ppGpp synthetase/guanosine-3',5'-bis(diphosphate) 3'-pyrophosphohydrolase [Pyrinomonadaceae bacterium]MBP6212169.1 bifunctional (p)ppGpp synthetase/guanosine-3',5'-bis(diphosphate) 3'-pyrophosphohydrolase [Pyrinomonadaceae bacterium]
MNNLNKTLQAARFAAEKHTGHFRKGSRREPYINHPIEVANLIANVAMVDDEDILSAALLHDTVEDCDVSPEEITEKFGETVCGYVMEVTDDKGLPKHERKLLQIEHAPHLSYGAKVIKLADKISNVRDVIASPAEDWDKQRRVEYVQWAVNVVEGLRGASDQLDELFDEVVALANEKLDEVD